MRSRTNAQRARACPALTSGGSPGQALLAAVDDHDQPSVVAQCDWAPGAAPWVGSARRLSLHPDAAPLADRAAALGWRAAPLVRVAQPPVRPPSLFCVEDYGGAGPLQGASFGLALALGAASWVAGTALRPGVAALGALGPDDTVQPVRGVAAKARMLAAVGVRELWVCLADAVHVPTDLDLQVRTAQRVGEVVSQVLADPYPQPLPDHRVEHLLRWVELGEPAIADWAPIMRTLAWLRSQVAAGQRQELERAQQIVQRHLDDPRRPPFPVRPERLPRPVRLRRIAHVVQDHTDSGAIEGVDELLDRALAHVAEPLERTAGDLWVLGAAGRLAACTGRLPRARGLLVEAIEGWFVIQQPAEACRPVCELLRCAGIDGVDVEAARGWAERLRPSVDGSLSEAFLCLAEGRLAVQRREEAGGLRRVLSDGPEHVQHSARRWWLRGGQQGPPPHAGSAYAWLMVVDQAVACGDAEGVAAGIEGLRGRQRRRVAQVLSWRGSEGWGAGRQVGEAWPY